MEATSEFGLAKAKRALDFGRMCQIMAIARDPVSQVSLARKRSWGRVAEALESIADGRQPGELDAFRARAAVGAGTSYDASWAGPLTAARILASEFVDFLRPLHVAGRVPFRQVDFNVKFAGATSGTSAAFVGEGMPLALTRQDFASLTLGYAKLQAMTLQTDELIRFGSPNAAATISADLANACAYALDYALLNPDKSAVADVSPASLTNGGQQIASSGTTIANLVADMKSALRYIDSAGIPVSQCWWILSQSVAIHLATALGSTSVPAFADFALDGSGRLFGLPAVVSGALITGNSPTEGLIVLVHPDSVAYASDQTADIEVSSEAALEASDVPSGGAQSLRSLWQQNETAIKVTRYANWIMRRSHGIVCIRGVNV